MDDLDYLSSFYPAPEADKIAAGFCQKKCTQGRLKGKPTGTPSFQQAALECWKSLHSRSHLSSGDCLSKSSLSFDVWTLCRTNDLLPHGLPVIGSKSLRTSKRLRWVRGDYLAEAWARVPAEDSLLMVDAVAEQQRSSSFRSTALRPVAPVKREKLRLKTSSVESLYSSWQIWLETSLATLCSGNGGIGLWCARCCLEHLRLLRSMVCKPMSWLGPAFTMPKTSWQSLVHIKHSEPFLYHYQPSLSIICH